MPSVSTPAAIVGGSILSGAIGGAAQSNAANTAAKAEEQASQNAINAQEGFFNTANQNLQPTIQTGNAAENKLAGLEGLNGGGPSSIQSTLQSLPGYQFALQQGLKSTQNSATERGLGLSGASLKGASAYSTGLANEYYNNLLTGVQNTANTGAGAAESLAGDATQTGQGVAQNTSNIGQEAGAGALATGAGIANSVSGIPSSLIAGQYLQNQSNNINGVTPNAANALTGLPPTVDLSQPTGFAPQ